MGIQAISSTPAVDLTALSQAQVSKRQLAASEQVNQASQSGQAAQTGQAAPQRPAGPPPARGGGAKMAAPAAAQESSETNESTESTEESSSTSSAAVIYDKRDANQDGTVSYQEELLYSIKHPTEQQASAANQEQTAATASQLQSGLKAYQQGQQGNSTANSSLILAG